MMKQMVIDDTLLDALDMNVDSMISDLVSLVAIKDGIDGLEDFDYENMSEELCNAIANEKETLLGIIDSIEDDPTKIYQQLLLSSGFFSKSLVNEIMSCIYECFSLEVNLSSLTYYRRMAKIFRIRGLFIDISNGILQYGVEPYQLIKEEDEKLSLFKGVDQMEEIDLEKEVQRDQSLDFFQE